MSDTNVGRFVWYELMATDPAAAVAFYTDVVGWKTQAWNDDYTMWLGSQGPLGGTMKLPDAAKKMGAPPHWMGHVEVADVDATAAKVKHLGGHILVEPNDIPKVGRFSVIADPQGASISVFKPNDAMAAHDSEKPGEICWNELLTTDHEAAFHFYAHVFGWHKLRDHDMGPMGKYLIYGRHGKELGGMFTKPKDAPMPTTWIYYIQIADLDAAIGRAKAKDARLVNGPMEVPGGARIAQLFDPQGAFFAMHEVAKK